VPHPRLYAPFEVLPPAAGKTRKRYVRLTYTVRDADGSPIHKTFPGRLLNAARIAYQDLLIWGIWYGRSYRNPTDRRRAASICLRPVPKPEQPQEH